MNKIKYASIIIILFIVFLSFTNNSYAKTSEWHVKIFGTDNFEETHNIEFKIEDNPHVAKGKFAPGSKATANVEIDLNGTEVDVDVYALIDDSNLNKSFKLNTKIEDNNILDNKIIIKRENSKVFTKKDGKKVLVLELVWLSDTNNNTLVGIEGKNIEIPIKIYVSQHI